jgi:hypothetical protein
LGLILGPSQFLALDPKKPGVDVMITNFCGFSQFLAKNGVFLKYQCYDQFFSKFSLVF